MSGGFFGGGMAASYAVGQLIDLPFMPSPIPRGFAHWDGDIHAITSYQRLFNKIGQTFRKAGDTFNTATHFRMGGGEVFRKGASYSPATYSAGLIWVLGTPVITGAMAESTHAWAVTDMVKANAVDNQTGKKRFCIRFVDAKAPGDTVFIVAAREGADLAPHSYIQLALFSNFIQVFTQEFPGQNHYSQQFTGITFNAGDEVGLWVDTDTGAWGFIRPDGTDSGDLSATLPAFTGACRAGFGVSTPSGGGHEKIVMDVTGGSLTFPAGYSDWEIDSSSTPASTNAGRQGGSNTTAGHAVTIAQMPAHTHPVDAGGQAAVQAHTNAFAYPAAEGNQESGSVGGGEEHSHDGVDPVHDTVITLVRV